MSVIENVLSSEKPPSGNARTNSAPSGGRPWIECGTPEGKYQRSPGSTSSVKLWPSLSTAVMRALPASMKDHSAALCQCSSRTPPALSRMLTPARSTAAGSSRVVTSRDQPPSLIFTCVSANA